MYWSLRSFRPRRLRIAAEREIDALLSPSSPGVVATLAKLRAAMDPTKIIADLTDSNPESPELDFLSPDPLADEEAHLKVSGQTRAESGSDGTTVGRCHVVPGGNQGSLGRDNPCGTPLRHCQRADCRLKIDRGGTSRPRLHRFQGACLGGEDGEGGLTARIRSGGR